VPYELIEILKINNMWETINKLSLTNREISRLTKVHILEKYVWEIKTNIRILGHNPYILPAKVLAYIYKDTITVSEDKYLFNSI